ncbi:hypothetical protein DL98DRAFT_319121 [Cadophora sp. DSE1049]|nr:hypothetical protein DL98DRAFT_319121 [Cadophora sp. DSE1049]
MRLICAGLKSRTANSKSGIPLGIMGIASVFAQLTFSIGKLLTQEFIMRTAQIHLTFKTSVAEFIMTQMSLESPTARS